MRTYCMHAIASVSDALSTFNYRIGIWGFYALPGLLLENETLNYGLQDQVAALNVRCGASV